MKKALLSIGLCLALIMGTNQSHAQSGRLSIGLEGAQPMGDFGDAASTGFGGSLRYEFPMGDKLGLMATAGYIVFGGKEEGQPDWALIPVQLGAKFYFKEQQAGLYVAAHVGVHAASIGDQEYTDALGNTYTVDGTSETKFSYAPEAGFHMSKLDLGLRYQFITASEGEKTLSYLGLRIAFVLGGE